jgi:DNA-binding HxlR family transcriptional regulator
VEGTEYEEPVTEGNAEISQLNRGINGVSQQMLTQQFRQLETDGLIGRKIYPEVPPRVEYSPTVGQTLKPIFDAMHIWGSSCLEQVGS